MADLTGTTVAANYEQINGGVNGLGGKTVIITMGMGGGAITEANLADFVKGITSGASLQTNDTTPDVFTVAGIGNDWDPGVSTAIELAIQGTGSVSTVTGDYLASATVAVVTTFEDTFEGAA